MKSKEKDIAKTICNEIFSSIGKLLVKGAEEAFVSGEYEIYKSGKQAGLYEAKKAVKGVLEGYLREESIKKVEVDGFTQLEELEVEKEKLYSELVVLNENYEIVVPKSFVDYLKNNGYFSENSFEFYNKQKISLNIRVYFKKYHFTIIFYNDSRSLYYSGTKDTTLTDFKKILEEAEGCTLPNEVEKEKLYSELVIMDENYNIVAPKSFVNWLESNKYQKTNNVGSFVKNISQHILYVDFHGSFYSVHIEYKEYCKPYSGSKNTTLTDFKKIIEQAENYTPSTNGEK